MAEQKTDLIALLKQIPDSRRQAGCRHELWACLLLVIMTMLTGEYGYRPTGGSVAMYIGIT